MNQKLGIASRAAAAVRWLSLGTAAIYTIAAVAAIAVGALDAEKKQAIDSLELTRNLIQAELEGISTLASDYGTQEGTSAYVASGDGSFLRRRFSSESLRDLELDLVALYDQQGTLLSSLAREGKAVPEHIPASIAGPHPFAKSLADGSPVSGLIDLGSGVYLGAVAGITRKDGFDAIRGALFFGREVGPELADKISKISGVAVSFIPVDVAAVSDEKPRVIRSGLNDPLIGRLRIVDIFDKPAVVVRTSEQRVAFRLNHRTILLIIGISILVLVAVFALLHKLLANFIDSPLRRLEETVADKESVNLRLEHEANERTSDLGRANRELHVYRSALEEITEGVVITDPTGSIIETNRAFREMSGYSKVELVGQNPRIMKSEKHDAAFFRAMWDTILETGRWEGEIWDKKKDGTVYPKWMKIDALRDGNGNIERYVGVCADISRIKQAEENLNRMAFFDSLTGLPNRALFQDRFKQALSRAQRTRSRVALIYLDLDHFKHVNDSMGHHAGDLLLRDSAKRIASQVREADTVCRIGGDEFTIILESIGSSADAAVVARKIIAVLKEPFRIENADVFIGTSIGISLFPFDGTNPDELVKRADSAMYEAKERGRGQLRFASGDSGVISRRRLETETKLRRGLDGGELFLHFQPQVSAGGAMVGSNIGILGAEALVRWRPPGGKIVPPDAFIEVAEETGLIVPLGAYVLKEACAESKRWLDHGNPLVVSVNVSQLQFERAKIIDQVTEALKESGLPPQFLKLEITESLFTRDVERMAEIMRELKTLGVSFAVDDFGTGYSSLRYIDKLPIDTLKIDKSFIQRIDSRYEGGEIATAVVSLARSFGLESIAEGVETAEQLDALRSRGCDAIQGYFVSKPLSADDFRLFIATKQIVSPLLSLA